MPSTFHILSFPVHWNVRVRHEVDPGSIKIEGVVCPEHSSHPTGDKGLIYSE